MDSHRPREGTTGAYADPRRESGFILIELLAVVGLIGVISAIGSLRAISSS